MLGAHLRSNPTFPFPLLPKPRAWCHRGPAKCQVTFQPAGLSTGDVTALGFAHKSTAQSSIQAKETVLQFPHLLQSSHPKTTKRRFLQGCVTCQTGQMLEKAPSKGTASALFSPWKPGMPVPPSDTLHTAPLSPGLPEALLPAKPALKEGASPSTRGQGKGSAIHSTGTQHLRAWPSLD